MKQITYKNSMFLLVYCVGDTEGNNIQQNIKYYYRLGSSKIYIFQKIEWPTSLIINMVEILVVNPRDSC